METLCFSEYFGLVQRARGICTGPGLLFCCSVLGCPCHHPLPLASVGFVPRVLFLSFCFSLPLVLDSCLGNKMPLKITPFLGDLAGKIAGGALRACTKVHSVAGGEVPASL